MWTAFALAVAVAISLLLGYVSTSAAFAVAIAGGGHAPASNGTVRIAALLGAHTSCRAPRF